MTQTHLLLATDGSEPSLEAARLVRDLLNPAALARVTVLAVVAPLETLPFYDTYNGGGGNMLSQETWDGVTAAAERTAEDALRRTVAELHTTAPVETVVRRGSPADEIVRCAAEGGDARDAAGEPWLGGDARDAAGERVGAGAARRALPGADRPADRGAQRVRGVSLGTADVTWACRQTVITGEAR